MLLQKKYLFYHYFFLVKYHWQNRKNMLVRLTLCAKPPDRNQKKGQDLRYTFLNSSWHTDAKKIPEKLIYRRHLACFFQKTKFFWKKIFWLKLIYKVQKSFLGEKIFLWKFSKRLRKNSQLFFDAKFF